MTQMKDRNGDELTVGDRVQVAPKTTLFDRPTYLMRATGTVAGFGRTRARVALDDAWGRREETFKPFDLEISPQG